MTELQPTTPLTYDRPSDSVDRNRLWEMPWETEARRGALDLRRDGSRHRRYHSHFEDMLN